jgi:hypothetical protein
MRMRASDDIPQTEQITWSSNKYIFSLNLSSANNLDNTCFLAERMTPTLFDAYFLPSLVNIPMVGVDLLTFSNAYSTWSRRPSDENEAVFESYLLVISLFY